MKPDEFISYSRRDFDEVSAIIAILKKNIPELSIWFDVTGIESGDEFEDKIISAINNSSYVLFAVSDNSLDSPWTKDEVMYAKNTDKRVIPLMLKDGKLKDWFLFKFGRVDYIDTTDENHLEKLLRNLSEWTGKQRVQNNEGSIDVVPAPPILNDPEQQPSIGQIWSVGDYYDDGEKEGIIFWVDEDGKHGKIVSLKQTKAQWESGNASLATKAYEQYDGNLNMQKIRAQDPGLMSHPAFAWCAGLGSDWYLPAMWELRMLVNNPDIRNKVNDALEKHGPDPAFIDDSLSYWSSTEAKDCSTWAVYVAPLSLTNNPIVKQSALHVRAVAAF